MGKTSKNRHTRRYGQARPKRSPRSALWQRQDCRACAQPVILAEEDLGGGRLRGTLLEAAPDAGGVLVRNATGHLVRDYEHRVPGTERWRWHLCPIRNAPDYTGGDSEF